MEKVREPEWIVKIRRVIGKVWWYGGVSYPAKTPKREGLEGDYFAVTGDGLLELLFEVESWEGDGRLRYHNIYHNTEEGRRGYPSMFGRKFHIMGVYHNHRMTFPELLKLLGWEVQQENAKWSKGKN